MPVTETTPSLADLVSVYEDALTQWKECCDRASLASREETSAKNEVNAAQKAINAEFDKLKKAAPSDSDWKREALRD